MKSTLEQLKLYKNKAVVERFLETWEVPSDEGNEIFEETKKWLWLSAYNKQLGKNRITLAISPSIKLLDEMWHTFILFTKDYHDFCQKYFGDYLHHFPTARSEYNQTITEYEHSPETVIERNRQLFAEQYSLIYDLLGEDTLVKWYGEYLDKYTDEFLQQIWRWSFSPYDSRVEKSIRMQSFSGTLS